MPKSKPKVLIDTNILIPGLVFLKGNEHRILKLAEERRCKLGGHIEVVLRGSGRDRL